jgi:hypothetical protein
MQVFLLVLEADKGQWKAKNYKITFSFFMKLNSNKNELSKWH